MLTIKNLSHKAKKLNKTIVFPEAGFSERIIKCASFLNSKKIANVILIGDESALVLRYKNLGGMTIINPKTSDITSELAKKLFEKRKDKGMSLQEAEEMALDPINFGALLVENGIADCMVAGAETSSSKILKAALKIVGAKNKNQVVSTFMLLQGKNKMMPTNKMLLLADVGLNINPSAKEIVDITTQTVETAKLFDIKPNVALLSYSTNSSANGESAEKMKEAVKILKTQADFNVDGEMQLDCALCEEVRNVKFANCNLKGKANVLIFPDLQSGNIAYKAMQRFGNLQAIGPIIQNLNKPINDLSRGASVEDIIRTSLLTLLM